MNGKITVTRISEGSQFDHSGRSTPTVQVQFTVGDHGPFTETFPKQGWDPNAAKLKLQQFAQGLDLVTGY